MAYKITRFKVIPTEKGIEAPIKEAYSVDDDGKKLNDETMEELTGETDEQYNQRMSKIDEKYNQRMLKPKKIKKDNKVAWWIAK